MADVKHELNVLVVIAKLDEQLAARRSELAHIPEQTEKVDKAMAGLAKRRLAEVERFESMQKERRELEQQLQDDESKIAILKGKLMEVQSNREYQAMLKEIAAVETLVGSREERLLELMDEVDSREDEHEALVQRLEEECRDYEEQKARLETRAARLASESQALEAEKPRHFTDMSLSLRRKYERLMEALGGKPAVRVEGENCGGCGTRIPPQFIHEIHKNDSIIICEACGRILVHYAD